MFLPFSLSIRLSLGSKTDEQNRNETIECSDAYRNPKQNKNYDSINVIIADIV